MSPCPKSKELKYLRVLLSEGMMGREIDSRIGAAGAVLHALHRTVVMKRELSRKAKLSIYWSILVPTLTYSHECWAVTERTRLRVEQSRTAAPLRGKEPVEVVWASDEDATRVPS